MPRRKEPSTSRRLQGCSPHGVGLAFATDQEAQGILNLRINKKGKFVDQRGRQHELKNGIVIRVHPPKKPKPLKADKKIDYSLIIAKVDENSGYANIYGAYPYSPSYAEKLYKWLGEYIKWVRHYHPEYFVAAKRKKK